MENRIVKFKSKESAGLNLHAIPGHFATSHSHINYYVDVTSIKPPALEYSAVLLVEDILLD